MSRTYPPDYQPKCSIEPTDLDDLCNRAGPYAAAAKAEVEWGAITKWLMDGSAGYQAAIEAADIPGRVASLSVLIVSKARKIDAGWPHPSGKVETAALYNYSADAQSEAQRTAEDIYRMWDAAGRPHVDAERCKFTYRLLVAAAERGLIDGLPAHHVAPATSTEQKSMPSHSSLHNFSIHRKINDRTFSPPSHQG
ncbi:hypothetical protein [Sphingobium sp. Z007]|uniref:hypothetical protein n=1 Tax=Sphingobium sp. Z007 TaxID=627495 RepID=UPI0011250033|nr:hypothetical protein [Sphingobium sp. Z007]